MEDGWIEWRGGECPLPNGASHEVRLRCGRVVKDDEPETWLWFHSGNHDDIVAYRIINSKE